MRADEESLMESGKRKIAWVTVHMPLLAQLNEEFRKEKPFAGHRIGMSIHLEAKTARLAILLRDGGGQVYITGSNPLSTQDDVATALDTEDGIHVHARRGVNDAEYRAQLQAVLAGEPDLLLDDGGDLVAEWHTGDYGAVRGGCEETTTGVRRLRARAANGELRIPMFAVNDARMKYLFDNRYGTGQSVWEGIMRATNLLIAGKSVVVAGYGWCGRGIAMRAHGLGARVTVCEVDPIRAVEAVMDGFTIAPLVDAIRTADFLVTSTGCRDVVSEAALRVAKDGIILANAGHFDVEIDKPALGGMSAHREEVRPGVEEFRTHDGRRIYLLGEGRLVNLVLGDGHPAEIMDISFALQALTLRHIVENGPFSPGVHFVPREIDEQAARMKLDALGVNIDTLTAAQTAYLHTG